MSGQARLSVSMPVTFGDVSIAPPQCAQGQHSSRRDRFFVVAPNPFLSQPSPFLSRSQVDLQFYRFLSNFFELHSEFKAEGGKTRPIFFTGESHAGHYIPSMVSYILKHNEAVRAAGKVRAGSAV